MSEEEIIKMLEHSIDTYIEDTKVTKVELTTEQAKVLLDLYNKQKEEIQQKDIMNEALKNAIGNILQGQKWCKEIKGGTTIRINLIKEKEKRIKNALLYLKTMEESEDTYELEKILKGE